MVTLYFLPNNRVCRLSRVYVGIIYICVSSQHMCVRMSVCVSQTMHER